MVAHGARSLFVKLLDMKMWDGFLKITISVIWSGQRENLLSFATASGFSGSTEFSCMAGNHDQKRISNLPPDEPNWILIVFVIADEPSTIPSSPTLIVAAIFFPTLSGKYSCKLSPHYSGIILVALVGCVDLLRSVDRAWSLSFVLFWTMTTINFNCLMRRV